MGEVILVGGGVRSGKSRFALSRAAQIGGRRAFVATATRTDDEMIQRIDRHQADRANTYETFEIPIDLAPALQRITHEFDVVVIDCLTLWTSNLLIAGQCESEVLSALQGWLDVVRAGRSTVICVTNEVGMGLIAPTELGRQFADVAGRVHQRTSERASEVYVAILGMLLRLKPGPVETITG